MPKVDILAMVVISQTLTKLPANFRTMSTNLEKPLTCSIFRTFDRTMNVQFLAQNLLSFAKQTIILRETK